MSADPTLEDGMTRWEFSNQSPDRPPEEHRISQAAWEMPINVRLGKQLLQNAPSVEDAARLLAGTQPEAGAWLGVLPSPQLGTHLSNESFRIACALRYGCCM